MKPKKVAKIEVEAIPPYDFESCVQKWTRYGSDWYWASPFEIYHPDLIWTGVRLSSGLPLGLKIKSQGSVKHPRLMMHMFSEERISNAEEKEALNKVIRCLCAHADISDFYELAEKHPILKQAKEDKFGMRATPLPSIFDALVLAITLQMASYGRTEKMIKLVYLNYGSQLEFDGKTVFVCPTAQKIASIYDDELKTKCRLGYRVSSLKANAHLVASKQVPDYELLAKMQAEEARKTLLKMKGIGEYSADVIMFGIHPSFPVDTWSQKIFCQIFGIPRKPSIRETLTTLRDFVEHQFGKWKGYVFDYLLNDFDALSKRLGLQL